MINCAEFEVLLADSLDGALDAPGREQERDAFAHHLETCEECAAMAEEVRSAVAFMQIAAEPEPPQELTGRILHATNSGWELKLRGAGIRGWINRAFAPILKPRFVMGAMLTIMSMTMLTRCAGGTKSTLTAADLDPVRLWTTLDSRGHRVWDRAVKGYESMRLVYEIRNQISDWNAQQAADEEAAADAKANSRKLPSQPEGAVPATGRPIADRADGSGK
jgi:anti-sigma factor RsiW